MKLSEFLDVSMGTFHIIEIEDDNSMVIVDDTHYLADMYDDYEVKAVYPEYFEHGFMENDCNWHGTAPDDEQLAAALAEINA